MIKKLFKLIGFSINIFLGLLLIMAELLKALLAVFVLYCIFYFIY